MTFEMWQNVNGVGADDTWRPIILLHRPSLPFSSESYLKPSISCRIAKYSSLRSFWLSFLFLWKRDKRIISKPSFGEPSLEQWDWTSYLFGGPRGPFAIREQISTLLFDGWHLCCWGTGRLGTLARAAVFLVYSSILFFILATLSFSNSRTSSSCIITCRLGVSFLISPAVQGSLCESPFGVLTSRFPLGLPFSFLL